MSFLDSDASPAQLCAAIGANTRWWYIRTVRVAGGAVLRRPGLLATYTPQATDDLAILFPRLATARAGEHLDETLAYFRSRRSQSGVLCWSLDPPPLPDLGARLAARGFRWGFRPHWMALDLRRLRHEDTLPNVEIGLLARAEVREVADLPYYTRANAAHLDVASRSRPRRLWHVGAWMDGALVGHSVLHLTTGKLGVGGIFNVGVVPQMRRRGIGAAVTAAACRLARAHGCRYAVLNATPSGEPVYRRLGFVSLGEGQIWWLPPAVLAGPPPAPEEVAFAEAIGQGSVETLEQRFPHVPVQRLDAPLLNGMLPLQLAVKTGQQRTAQWLVARGATLDVLSAWDLGWKERVPGLLERSPGMANRRSGEWQATPLHEAALRNDLELARVVLRADPDLSIEDGNFHSTALGWAKHFQRAEIVNLLQQHEAG
ncbi:MAG TPA: GNAT family N-acetyltransferase [Chloroflexota bacterium]